MAERAKLIEAMKYRCIGPVRGGRVVAVAGDPVNKSTFYFGSTGGGVWKTTDGGVSWRNVSDGYFNWASVGALQVAPSDPNVIYAGMGETSIRGNVSRGDGVYKSTDAGQTWQHMGLAETQNIGEIQIHREPRPRLSGSPRTRLGTGTGTRRLPLERWRPELGTGPPQEQHRRCSRSGNGPQEPAHSLCRNLGRQTRTALSLVRRQRFRYVDVDRCRGQLERDHPQPWPAAGRGHRQDRVSASGAKAGRVYAIVEAEDGAVFRSDDYGATWTRGSEDRNLRQRAWYYHHIYADPNDPDTVYVLNVNMWRSIGRQDLRVDFRPARRHPRPLDRPGGFQPDDSGR
ncbi:MAG: hypothetical protein R3A46_12180 [Thermomicrobiales bacterium]